MQRSGTEQLILSDAVDRSVDQLDLSPLAGRKVYLETKYMLPVKGTMFINAEYIISAIRQRMIMAGCTIEDDRLKADYVLEGRVAALGADSVEVTYGVPSSSGLTQAAAALGSPAPIPIIPEVSLGRRDGKIGIAKVSVFAYHRETGTPVWQSGDTVARSDAKDSWMFGIGPWTRGSVYDEHRFAGNRLRLPFLKNKRKTSVEESLDIADTHQFVHPAVLEKHLEDAKAAEEKRLAELKAAEEKRLADLKAAEDETVRQASHTESTDATPPAAAPPAAP